jgi:hypothetical protein
MTHHHNDFSTAMTYDHHHHSTPAPTHGHHHHSTPAASPAMTHGHHHSVPAASPAVSHGHHHNPHHHHAQQPSALPVQYPYNPSMTPPSVLPIPRDAPAVAVMNHSTPAVSHHNHHHHPVRMPPIAYNPAQTTRQPPSSQLPTTAVAPVANPRADAAACCIISTVRIHGRVYMQCVVSQYFISSAP